MTGSVLLIAGLTLVTVLLPVYGCFMFYLLSVLVFVWLVQKADAAHKRRVGLIVAGSLVLLTARIAIGAMAIVIYGGSHVRQMDSRGLLDLVHAMEPSYVEGEIAMKRRGISAGSEVDVFSGEAMRVESGIRYSIGPDQEDQHGLLRYDPTNGTFSAGDIVLVDQGK